MPELNMYHQKQKLLHFEKNITPVHYITLLQVEVNVTPVMQCRNSWRDEQIKKQCKSKVIYQREGEHKENECIENTKCIQ